MELQYKKGDLVRVTTGARRNEEGTVTEIREGVTFSVQVQFGDRAVPTPYAPNELALLPPRDIAKPNYGCMTVIAFGVILWVCVISLMAKCSHDDANTEQQIKPLSDTVARIPNP